MVVRTLKYILLSFNEEEKTLRIYGNNKFVMGEIFIRYNYLYTVLVFIMRIFRRRIRK